MCFIEEEMVNLLRNREKTYFVTHKRTFNFCRCRCGVTLPSITKTYQVIFPLRPTHKSLTFSSLSLSVDICGPNFKSTNARVLKFLNILLTQKFIDNVYKSGVSPSFLGFEIYLHISQKCLRVNQLMPTF